MSLSIAEIKKHFRTEIKSIKKLYSNIELQKKSSIILNSLNTLPEVKAAEFILSYWSLNDEVCTHKWNIEQHHSGKTILLPKVKDDDLEIHYFDGENKLVTTEPFGIKEPANNAFSELSKIKIIIVPGIAFDKSFHRLGRGKGYYDRFLTKTNAIKIGVCFNFQFFENIPYDNNDITMDIIVNEDIILKK